MTSDIRLEETIDSFQGRNVTVISNWTHTSEMSALPDRVIHVWAWQNHSSDESSDPDLSKLSEQEVERCLRFRFERDRISFATSHRNTRLILAHYLGKPPEELTITPQAGGKPRLHGAGSEHLRFNLSHCKDVGMLAVAWNTEIGIDVEQPRHVHPGVAERYFSPAELQELSQLDDDEWRLRFPALLDEKGSSTQSRRNGPSNSAGCF